MSALDNLVALNVSFKNFSVRAPETTFFVKLPISDVEGNPVLCLSRCPGDTSDRERTAQRSPRVSTAVLLSALVVT